jgi:hypothetical protein
LNSSLHLHIYCCLAQSFRLFANFSAQKFLDSIASCIASNLNSHISAAFEINLFRYI